MGLTEAGYPARDYSNNRPRPAVRLYEGNLVFDAAAFDYTGRNVSNWKVSAPMHIGQYVELHEDSTPRDLIVKPATKASTAIGKLIINPALESGMGWTDDEINVLPRENKNWGHYVPRGGTVELFGAAIDELKVVAQNEAIAAGNYLDSEANEEFAKSTDPTNWIALAKVPALASGYVPALALK